MNELTTTNASQTMSSREIAELTEKRHDSVKRTIGTLAENGVISHPQIVDGPKSANGVVEKQYLVGKRDSYVVVAQISPEFTARLVDRWQELEAQLAPRVPRSLVEALRLAADKAEEAERLAIERDAAIATKAEIGSRREATAMATASNATQRATRLEVELDRSKQYATIKRMGLVYHGLSFNWRELKTASIDMDLPPIDVFDSNYGTVKSYHSDVWKEVYGLEVE